MLLAAGALHGGRRQVCEDRFSVADRRDCGNHERPAPASQRCRFLLLGAVFLATSTVQHDKALRQAVSKRTKISARLTAMPT